MNSWKNMWLDWPMLVLMKTIKPEERIELCPVTANDELYQLGIFEFNITKLLEYIHANPDRFPLSSISVEDFYPEHAVINKRHLKTLSNPDPVILAEISPGRYDLIDGNHRMQKAKESGVSALQAYKVPMVDHVRFLTSTKAYTAYVDYWNGKLAE